jgi:hypothetical protein
VATNADNAASLRVALATGVKSCLVDGITVVYQDTSEQMKALAYFEGRAAADAVSTTGVVPIGRVNVAIGSPC